MKTLKSFWICASLFLLIGTLTAAPPQDLKLTWDAYPASYIGTNDVGQVFTNYLTGYRLYWSQRLDTPVSSWTLQGSYSPSTIQIVVPFIEGAQFFVLTASWTTNGSSPYFFVEGETRPSNVTGALLHPSGKNFKAARP